MIARSLAVLGAAFALCLAPAASGQSSQSLPPLRYEKFVLPNGLRVILHEDHSVPLATVNVDRKSTRLNSSH